MFEVVEYFVQLIASQGVAIGVMIALFVLLWKMNEQNRSDSEKWRETISNNTEATKSVVASCEQTQKLLEKLMDKLT